MKKSELQSLTVGMWIVSKKDNSKHQITAVVEETGKIGLDGHKVYTFSTIQRWYDVAKAQNGGLEPEDIVTEDTTQVEDTEEQTNTSDLQDTDTQGNEIHEDTEQTGQQDVVEGNIADKLTKEDIIHVIEHSNCDAVVKKQYIGVYKEGYKGTVCMVRTTRKGNTHIDIKQGIFNSLAESTRTRLEAKYIAKVYDQSRGYIRLFEVDDLAVLQDLILFVLGVA